MAQFEYTVLLKTLSRRSHPILLSMIALFNKKASDGDLHAILCLLSCYYARAHSLFLGASHEILIPYTGSRVLPCLLWNTYSYVGPARGRVKHIYFCILEILRLYTMQSYPHHQIVHHIQLGEAARTALLVADVRTASTGWGTLTLAIYYSNDQINRDARLQKVVNTSFT